MMTNANIAEVTNYVFVDWDGIGKTEGEFNVYDNDAQMPAKVFSYGSNKDRRFAGESYQKAERDAVAYAKKWSAKLGCEWGDNLPPFGV